MTARLLRLIAVVPVLAGLTVTLHVARVGPTATGCALAAGTHHAALVVQHADGEPLRMICVSFAADSITGEELLNLSNVPYRTADYGSTGKAVCQIDNEPQQYPPGCWTASSPYWAMFVSRGGAGWQTSSRGISSQTFGDGDAEGFRYEGQSDNSTPPSPSGVCPPPVTPTASTPPATSASSAPAPGTSRPTASAPGGAASAVASASIAAAATATAPAPGTTAPPYTLIPSSSSSASAHPVIAGVTAPPSPPATSVGAGAWTAIALGAALFILLAARLSIARLRRRTTLEQP